MGDYWALIAVLTFVAGMAARDLYGKTVAACEAENAKPEVTTPAPLAPALPSRAALRFVVRSATPREREEARLN